MERPRKQRLRQIPAFPRYNHALRSFKRAFEDTHQPLPLGYGKVVDLRGGV